MSDSVRRSDYCRFFNGLFFHNKEAAMYKKFEGYPHVTISQHFDREWLEKVLFVMADDMKQIFNKGGAKILKGKKLVSFFYEPSTRTRMSMEMAIRWLGGELVFSTENAREFSSGAKGESLQDTIRVVNRYRPDVIHLRYDREIGAEIAASISEAAIINGGDRNPGQHPTQGLLDITTIQKCLGGIDGLTVAMVGDLEKGRTARSLAYLLAKFRGVAINFVSPLHAKMKDDVKDYLFKHEVPFAELTDLRQVIAVSDVIYQTRTQIECGSHIDRKDPNQGYFLINGELMKMAKGNCIVMHPLPRVDEITEDVDDDPRAVYLTTQVDCGLYVRMALLKMILAPEA